MNRHVLLIAIAGVLGIVVGLVADTVIASVAQNEAKRLNVAEMEHKGKLYRECIREAYPTLTVGMFGGYVDSRTGTRYNVAGTEQDALCQSRVYNR